MNSSSSSSASEPPSSASSISSLHRLLALECAFTFLSLADLSRIVRVCVEWRSLVQSMPSLAVTSVYPRLFQPLCASPLARHISRFDEQSMKYKPRGSHTQTLAMIAERMTALQSLRWELQKDALDSRSSYPLRFPPALRELDLVLPGKATARESDVAVHAITSLRHLRTLTLRSVRWDVSLRPLVDATALRHLTVHPPDNPLVPLAVSVAGAQLDDIRLLTQLHSLMLPMLDWIPLLQPPHALKLQSVTASSPSGGSPAFDLFPDLCTALHRLPSLTHLDCRLRHDSSLMFLCSMPHLSRLHAHFGLGGSSVLLRSALEASSHAAMLTDVFLDSASDLNAAGLSAMLRCMPRLHRLRLRALWKLESLRFLTDNPPLFHSLAHFSMSSCRAIPAAEHVLLQSLASLESLYLSYSFVDDLGPQQQRVYTAIPNAIFPRLTKSEYVCTYP